METHAFNFMVTCMNINKARARLLEMENSIYPDLKAPAQKKLHRKVYKQAIPPELRKEKAVSVHQLGNMYGMGSIEDILAKKKVKNG